MWCHKHLKSLSCPHQKAVPFSLSSFLLFSFTVMPTGKGHQAQLQNAPSAFTEEQGFLKGSTNHGGCRVVSLRPHHDHHCFSIYRKVSDFLFPLCQPIAQYSCTLESKHHLEELREPFHFYVFTVYIQMKHTVYIFRWGTCLKFRLTCLKSGSSQNSFGHCVNTYEKEQIPPRKQTAMRKHKTWSLNTTCFLQELQSRHSPNPSFKTQFLKVQQGPGYFWFALFSVFEPQEHWEVPMPTAPHPSATSICSHLDRFWCRTTTLHTRDVVPPAVSGHHDIPVLSLPLRRSENENCAPHTMHDFASSAPRNLQTASKDHER